ncbi:MAG: universal stress protein [Candidatus Eisenbacteria bacterium]|nr:universal stress protein [Candidatus Eisenbacteria bacterium]
MFSKILIAVDGSHHADAAVEAGIELSKAGDAGVTLCHVSSIPEQYRADLADQIEEALLDEGRKILEHARRVAVEAGAEPETRLVERQHPAEAIVALASEIEADLIVVGVRGKTTDALRSIGSVSQAVAQEAECSVLLVR